MTYPATSNYTPHVLVVDDDWMTREVIEAYLATAGYRITSTHSGEQALELVRSESPDLVMLDIRMPGLDGFEVCQRLKSDPGTRFTPVVMVTALESDEDKLLAIESGADDFVTKPFNSLLMLTRVRSLLRIKQLHDEVEARNRLLRQVLTRYVDEDITNIILSDPEKYLQLGGETRAVTVFFSDIRGFTAFAEQHSAAQVVTSLNRVFSALTEVIFRYRGTFDKYIGDELMAFFGAPVASEDDTYNALCMALEMQQVFECLKVEQTQPSLAGLSLGMGLHSGEAAVGNVGSERVMSYTVIGDTVNIAHRLEETALPGQVLISEATYRLAEPFAEATRLPPRVLPGKRDPITVYELHALRG